MFVESVGVGEAAGGQKRRLWRGGEIVPCEHRGPVRRVRAAAADGGGCADGFAGDGVDGGLHGGDTLLLHGDVTDDPFDLVDAALSRRFADTGCG